VTFVRETPEPVPEESPFRNSAGIDPPGSGEISETTSVEANQSGIEECSESNDDVPSLESIVSKIPASNREFFDELFRGKFVAVRKVDENELR
jgi:hypothetical protein